MMVVESNGNPKVTSPAGARGLLQVTPITMEELAEYDPKRFGKYVTTVNGRTRVNIDALSDPKTGIEAGMAALKMYMDRYDGDAEKALAAYNWGPKNVKAGEALDLSGAPDETQRYLRNFHSIFKQTRTGELPRTSLLHYLPPALMQAYRASPVTP